MMLHTIEDIEDAHKGHWFDEDTLGFWGSHVFDYVHPDSRGGAYFISSEDNFDRTLKLFSVRHCTEDGVISTPSWQEYTSWNQAKAEIAYITSFQWERDVPVWAVLRFAQIKAAATADGMIEQSIKMVDWKATPKGGKLTYEVHGLDRQVQLYK